jgi:hypothetical protein
MFSGKIIIYKLLIYLFIYREGHLKTSSINYNINTTDSFVHLTNYSVQKYNKDFSKFEEGNEVSFSDFQTFLDKEYQNNKINVYDDLLKKMNDIIKISMLSVKDKINMFDRQHSFEIFGYDFIFDNEFNPFLLEINTNPGLEESSKLIKMLVPRMIDDAFRLTIDELFETKYSFSMEDGYNSPYQVPGYTNQENLWDYICNIRFKKIDLDNNINYKQNRSPKK